MERAWEHAVEHWCVAQGRWTPPPQGVEPWFGERAVRIDAQGWTLANKKNVLDELTESVGPFPVEHREGILCWDLDWDVRKGKVRARIRQGKAGKPNDLALMPGWTLV